MSNIISCFSLLMRIAGTKRFKQNYVKAHKLDFSGTVRVIKVTF